jgi:hypothetical protein
VNSSAFLHQQKIGPVKGEPIKGTQSFIFSGVDLKLLQETKLSPLFQLYSFLTRPLPLGLNGPFSENAPTPTDEQPGPTQTHAWTSSELQTQRGTES